MTEKHIIDPDGDCLFLLYRKPKSLSNESATTSNANIDEDTTTAAPSNASNDSLIVTLHINRSSSTQRSYNESSSNEDTSTEIIADPSYPVPNVHFLVSSKHMMLASPVFKAMLQQKNRFKEGEELHAKGKVEVHLPDDDVDAFLILMNIIHCRFPKVPRKVELEMLYSISILVDKYCMHESVQVFSEMWVDDEATTKALDEEWGSKNPISEQDSDGYLKQNLLWLSVAWVFGLGKIFNYATIAIVLESRTTVAEEIQRCYMDIPVPIAVIERLDSNRLRMIKHGFTLMDNLIDKYTRPVAKCRWSFGNVGANTQHRQNCDRLALGSIFETIRKVMEKRFISRTFFIRSSRNS